MSGTLRRSAFFMPLPVFNPHIARQKGTQLHGTSKRELLILNNLLHKIKIINIFAKISDILKNRSNVLSSIPLNLAN